MGERKYCKNSVPGRQGRGRKYPAKVRAEVVMAMIGSNSICAVARRYGVPEIAARAAVGAKAQVSYLQQRVAENQRAAEVRDKLHRRLDEDARARNYDVGVQLKSEDEALQDAMETGLVVRSAPGTYDRQLSDDERDELEKQLERYDRLMMNDRDAANVAAVLIAAAGAAAALAPKNDTGDGSQSAPAVLMEPKSSEAETEVVLDGTV